VPARHELEIVDPLERLSLKPAGIELGPSDPHIVRDHIDDLGPDQELERHAFSNRPRRRREVRILSTTMRHTTHIALLRGINVGGKGILPMSDLRAILEDLDLTEVRTYIQSGNALFQASGTASALATRIERAIERRFGFEVPTLVLTARTLNDVIDCAPKGFGSDGGKYRYDVAFALGRTSTREMAAAVTKLAREGVDTVDYGPKALYFRRLIARATQSRINKITALPFYRELTIRNWNTTTKLLALATQ